MQVLIIGGTGFIGPATVHLLVERGHEIALFHRGLTAANLPEGALHILGDRSDLPAYSREFSRFAPDVVLDMHPMTGAQAQAVLQTFSGIAQRFVAISSQDVYRAYGRLIGTEPGSPDPTPLAEDAPLRERLYPYRGATLRSDDDPKRWTDDYDKILVERA